MTGSATSSSLPDLRRPSVTNEGCAPQMSASSRPTRRRVSVPETSAITNPASQNLNRHRRKTLLSQYFLSRFIHAACQNTICYHFDERCPLHTAACTKNLNELNLQFLLYITSLTTLLYIDVRTLLYEHGTGCLQTIVRSQCHHSLN